MNRKKADSLMTVDMLNINPLQNASVNMKKLKLGEIFQKCDDSITINCIHCLQEFQFFTEFTLHIEEHYMNGEIQRPKLSNQLDSNPLIETPIKEEPPFDIQPKLEESNDENDYFDSYGECFDEGMDEYDNQNESTATNLIDKVSTLPSKNKSVELTAFGQIIQTIYVSNDGEETIRNNVTKHSAEQSGKAKNAGFQTQISAKGTDAVNKLECLVCKGRFSSKVSLANHTREVHEPPRFTCSLCLKRFARRRTTREHIKKVHGVRKLESINEILIYQSKVCDGPKANDAVQATERKTIPHLAPKKYERLDLYRDSSTSNSSRQHIHTSVDAPKKFECFVCHRNVPSLKSLRPHIRYRHGPKQFYCPFCTRLFLQPTSIKRHLRNTHGVNDHITIEAVLIENRNSKTSKNVFAEHLQRKFECFQCHRPFTAFKMLRNHIRTAHGAQNMTKLFSCPLCLARKCRLRPVQRHIKAVHGMSYTSKAILAAQPKSKELTQYMRELEAKRKRKPFICEICGWACTQQGNLNIHMDSHRNSKRVKCEICNKLVTASYRRAHMQIHTGEKKEQCTICGSRFLNKKALRNHMVRHVGKPEYKCDVCDKAFTRPYKLVEHRRLHPEEMPHVCRTCNVGFLSFNSLRIHQYKHERGEKVV